MIFLLRVLVPRCPRLDAPDALHHVIARGIERGTIFHDDGDRNDFVGGPLRAVVRLKKVDSSFLRKQESRFLAGLWTPAFAGVTKQTGFSTGC